MPIFLKLMMPISSAVHNKRARAVHPADPGAQLSKSLGKFHGNPLPHDKRSLLCSPIQANRIHVDVFITWMDLRQMSIICLSFFLSEVFKLYPVSNQTTWDTKKKFICLNNYFGHQQCQKYYLPKNLFGALFFLLFHDSLFLQRKTAFTFSASEYEELWTLSSLQNTFLDLNPKDCWSLSYSLAEQSLNTAALKSIIF